jgi:hypothetical protein
MKLEIGKLRQGIVEIGKFTFLMILKEISLFKAEIFP